ncbi:MAG: hypothetical protein KF773_16065 [Deltaproteobacteria bacterium]|nr:hypothetical protein [Deltaproteobacteria bacterium]
MFAAGAAGAEPVAPTPPAKAAALTFRISYGTGARSVRRTITLDHALIKIGKARRAT